MTCNTKIAAVSGVGGFLGQRLCVELALSGYEVFAISRKPLSANLNYLNINDVICASEDYEHLAEKIGTDINFFSHFAWEGVTGSKIMDLNVQQLNIERTLLALKNAASLKCQKFIGAGSIHEIECIKEKEAGENRAIYVQDYKIAKLSAHYFCEAEAARLGVEFIWPRITNAYGPTENSDRLFNSLIRKLQAGETPDLTDGTQLYNFIYADDAARAFRLIAESGKPNHPYIVGNKEIKPLREFLIELGELVAPKIKLGFGNIPTMGVRLDKNDPLTPELFSDLNFSPEYNFRDGIIQLLLFKNPNISDGGGGGFVAVL